MKAWKAVTLTQDSFLWCQLVTSEVIYYVYYYANIRQQTYERGKELQGVPKKIGILSSFEFLDLGGVFLGVKNNSKNFGNKKYIGLYSKILSK